MSRSAELDAKIAAMVERWKEHDAIYLAAKELRARKCARSMTTRIRTWCSVIAVFVTLYVKQLRRF